MPVLLEKTDEPEHTHELSELPQITRRDRARFVKEARRLRAAEIDKLLSTIGRGVARLSRTLVTRKPMQSGLAKA